MSLFKSKINEAKQELQLQLNAANESLQSLRLELTEAQELAATYKSEFERVCAELNDKNGEIESLNNQLAEASRDAAEFDERVAKAAAAQVASLGHEPLEVEGDSEPIDTIKTFKSLNGKELVEFYNSHKNEIAAALKGRA